MTYAALENSVQQSAPVELYQISQGTENWYFCSGEQEVVYQSRVYTPNQIERDRIKQSTDIFKNGLRLTFPYTDNFAAQFLGFAPDDVTSITILRGDYADPDRQFIVYWKGRVVSAKTAGSRIDIECESVYTSIRRPGLRARFEYSCRHVLYGRGCGLSRELHKFVSLVVSVNNGVEVNVAGAGVVGGADYFVGGILKSNANVTRFIVDQSGATLTLSRAIANLSGGQPVTIYPGCDHLRATCETKFNNLDNFGGFPWIPSRNPFDGSSIV